MHVPYSIDKNLCMNLVLLGVGTKTMANFFQIIIHSVYVQVQCACCSHMHQPQVKVIYLDALMETLRSWAEGSPCSCCPRRNDIGVCFMWNIQLYELGCLHNTISSAPVTLQSPPERGIMHHKFTQLKITYKLDAGPVMSMAVQWY